MKKRIAASGVAVAALISTVLMSSPAQAGPQCDWTGCSETINQSAYSVYVARDWCDGVGACSGSPTDWLAPGERTPDGQDWDTFRVDPGWCYRVNFNPGLTRTYDRRGSSTGLWVKVSNPEEAVVEFQSRSSC
ncbi:hypothetical protein AB0O64_37110 [Streptomyces sp. NPDC088341]|uniref:hypothetical protein n=1 Tax=Streptomyces sp. NPDC088341 TaxID=3154870 RepID=UPI003437C453